MKFALYFGNRGFMPGELITGARADMMKAVTDAGYELTGSMAEGDFIVIEIAGSQTEVGRSDNVVKSIQIKNASDKDVTANYMITCQNGVLRVTPN